MAETTNIHTECHMKMISCEGIVHLFRFEIFDCILTYLVYCIVFRSILFAHCPMLCIWTDIKAFYWGSDKLVWTISSLFLICIILRSEVKVGKRFPFKFEDFRFFDVVGPLWLLSNKLTAISIRVINGSSADPTSTSFTRVPDK